MLGREVDLKHSESFEFYHLNLLTWTTAGKRTTFEFRPGGPFAKDVLVLVDVETKKGVATKAVLVLDSGFIEDPANGKYARDIAKYFLKWIPPAESAAVLAPIAEELARKAGKAATGTQESRAYQAFRHGTKSSFRAFAPGVTLTIDPTYDGDDRQPIVALTLQLAGDFQRGTDRATGAKK